MDSDIPALVLDDVGMKAGSSSGKDTGRRPITSRLSGIWAFSRFSGAPSKKKKELGGSSVLDLTDSDLVRGAASSMSVAEGSPQECCQESCDFLHAHLVAHESEHVKLPAIVRQLDLLTECARDGVEFCMWGDENIELHRIVDKLRDASEKRELLEESTIARAFGSALFVVSQLESVYQELRTMVEFMEEAHEPIANICKWLGAQQSIKIEGNLNALVPEASGGSGDDETTPFSHLSDAEVKQFYKAIGLRKYGKIFAQDVLRVGLRDLVDNPAVPLVGFNFMLYNFMDDIWAKDSEALRRWIEVFDGYTAEPSLLVDPSNYVKALKMVTAIGGVKERQKACLTELYARARKLLRDECGYRGRTGYTDFQKFLEGAPHEPSDWNGMAVQLAKLSGIIVKIAV